MSLWKDHTWQLAIQIGVNRSAPRLANVAENLPTDLVAGCFCQPLWRQGEVVAIREKEEAMGLRSRGSQAKLEVLLLLGWILRLELFGKSSWVFRIKHTKKVVHFLQRGRCSNQLKSSRMKCSCVRNSCPTNSLCRNVPPEFGEPQSKPG